MRQVENINLIAYLENVLREIRDYHIDVTYYEEELKQAISCYEEAKEKERRKDIRLGTSLGLTSDYELDLNLRLSHIENNLVDYILFLDLIHSTENWKIDFEIDDLFYKVSSRFDSFLESFSTIDIQKLILIRYHDLLLKKIWKDYQSDDFDYVDKYNDLKKYPYLVDSIERFLNSDDVQFSLDGDIVCYDLRTILDRVYRFLNPIQEIVEVEDNSHSLANYDNSFVPFWRRILIGIRNYVMAYFDSEKVLENSDKMKNRINMNSKFMIDLMNRCDRLDKKHIVQRMYPGVDISWLGDVADEVIERVGIEWVKNKNLSFQDCRGLDLSSVDFTGVSIGGANLRNTGARIDPQRYMSERIFLKRAILKGCYVLNKFDGYEKENMPDLDGAILVDSFDEIEKFEKQVKKYGFDVRWLGDVADEVIERVGIDCVRCKSFIGMDLTGIDLSGVDFTDVCLMQADLTNTKARIVVDSNLDRAATRLRGCYVIVRSGSCEFFSNSPDLNGAILVNSFDEIEKIERYETNREDSVTKKKKLIYSRRSNRNY